MTFSRFGHFGLRGGLSVIEALYFGGLSVIVKADMMPETVIYRRRIDQIPQMLRAGITVPYLEFELGVLGKMNIPGMLSGSIIITHQHDEIICLLLVSLQKEILKLLTGLKLSILAVA